MKESDFVDELILSISMPNFNHASFLATRIPSLLEAMPSNAELIIIDDGSTDGSAKIIREFAEKDSRVVCLLKKQNEGVANALKDFLEIAKGKFFAFQSADDFIFPNFFSKMLFLTEKYPGYAVYASNYGRSKATIPKNISEVEVCQPMPYLKEPRAFEAKEMVQVFQTTDFWIPGHASIFDKEFIKKSSGFLPQLEPHSDWFLFQSLSFLGGCVYLPETLSVIRIDETSYSSKETESPSKILTVYKNFFRVLDSSHKKLQSAYIRSGILNFYIKPSQFFLLAWPKYWSYLWFFALRWFKIRRNKKSTRKRGL